MNPIIAKAFIQFLSEGIGYEYESKGITVQTVLPSLTKTKLVQGDFKNSFFCVSPEDFVSAAIKTVGIESYTFGHWKHKLLAYVMNIMSSITGRRLLTSLMMKSLKQSRDQFYQTIGDKID